MEQGDGYRKLIFEEEIRDIGSLKKNIFKIMIMKPLKL